MYVYIVSMYVYVCEKERRKNSFFETEVRVGRAAGFLSRRYTHAYERTYHRRGLPFLFLFSRFLRVHPSFAILVNDEARAVRKGSHCAKSILFPVFFSRHDR